MIRNTNLDWSDADGLYTNISSLSVEQENRVLYSREELARANRVDESKCLYGSYYSNSSIIAMSDWDRSKSYIMCGMYVDGKRKYCQEHRYCERCAYEKSRRIYNKYITAWRTQDVYWYHMTYSFKSNLSLKTASSSQYLARWKEADDYFRRICKEGAISGAIVVNELSIAGLAEQQVFPHTHAVVISDDPDLVENLQAMANPDVDLDIRAIDNEQYMLNCVKYPIKAIDLRKTYQEELPSYAPVVINEGVEIVLGKTTAWEKGWKKIKYIGRMNAMNPEYVGTQEVGRSKKRTTGKKKELKQRETSTRIISMDQKSQPSARALLVKEANPMLPAAAPQKKTMNPMLAGGLMAGGLWGADKLFNGGRATAGGLNWLRDKITPDNLKLDQQNELRDNELSAGEFGRATAMPHSDSTALTPDQAGTTAAARSAMPITAAADTAGLGVQAGSMMSRYFPKAFGWLGNAGTPAKALSSGLGSIPGKAATGLGRIAPAASNILAPLAGVTGALSGHDLASNPLVEEGWAEPVKGWWNPASWGMNGGETRNINSVRTGLRAVGGLAGGLGGSAPMLPVHPAIKAVGALAAPMADAWANHWEGNVRTLQAESDYKSQVKDHLMNLYAGARKGDVNSRNYLQRWLESRSAPGRAHELNSLAEDPIINNLINRSRNELFEAR